VTDLQLYLVVPLAPWPGDRRGLLAADRARGAHLGHDHRGAISFAASCLLLECCSGRRVQTAGYTCRARTAPRFEIGFLIDGLSPDDGGGELVSLMVHVYTVGYMATTRLPAFLRLHRALHFSDADAGDGEQFLQLFFGWEAVAWCPTC